MSTKTSIEWTATVNPDGSVTPGATWNPVRGCSVISPGCVNCYAMKQAHRFSGPGRAYEGLTKLTKAGPQWTGIVRPIESALLEPLSWRKPRRVFVNSMSDLFHEQVPFEFIDRVFAVMALARRHTFQILTKRPDCMRDYLGERSRSADYWKRACPVGYALEWRGLSLVPFPLPNVWLGVSVEDQKHADERIPLLLQTPAAVRFISAEPLLGPVDFAELPSHYDGENRPLLRLNALRGGHRCGPASFGPETPHLDWVIVGGESGPGARPFDLAWAHSLVAQCKAAGVACFVKQLGSSPYECRDIGQVHNPASAPTSIYPRNRKGGDPSEWPEDLRVREFPA